MTRAFTGQRGHAVYCWSGSASRAPAEVGRITSGLAATFGPAVTHQVTDQITGQQDSRGSAADRTGHQLQVRVGESRFGWEVASWLVTHASAYHIHQIRFGGYQWRAAAASKGWARDAGAPPAGRLVLS